MGNQVPIVPPRSSSNQVVIDIRSRRCGSLCVDPDDAARFPPPLAGAIERSEYDDKMSELQSRLDRWGGGRANLLAASFGLILAASVGFALLPGSPLLGSPLPLYGVLALELALVAWSDRLLRGESASLARDVEDMFRPWEPRVRSTVRKVGSGVVVSCCADKRRRRGGGGGGGGAMFCVVLHVVAPAIEEGPPDGDGPRRTAGGGGGDDTICTVATTNYDSGLDFSGASHCAAILASTNDDPGLDASDSSRSGGAGGGHDVDPDRGRDVAVPARREVVIHESGPDD